MTYDRFQGDELILRDELALDRTRLANERTVLAYARTGLMVIVTGVTAIKLFGDDGPYDNFAIFVSGWALVVLGVAIGSFGLWRFFTMAKELRHLRKAVDRERAARR